MGFVTAAILASTALSAGSQIQQGRAQARAARQNLQFSEQAAADVMERGQEDIATYRRQLSQVQGQQRVGLAAQGIDLTQGTAAQIAQQTQKIGEMDIGTIRRNIEREAWGIRTQANINYRAGMAQSQASMFGAGATLIGGMSQAFAPARGR